jgi:Cysteine rich repeat
MRRIVKCLLTVWVLSLLSGTSSTSWAQQDLLTSVKDGCKKELGSYCKEVTPGEGRVLACLFAFEDKLSPRCEYALYDASAQLQHAVASLSYGANECKADLEKHCSKVESGGGRLVECLKKNEKDLTARCKTAMKDIGLK